MRYRENTGIKQQILDSENAGRYLDAFSGYDYVLQSDPSAIFGLLDTLKNLGNYETMLHVVKAGYFNKTTDASYFSKLAGYGVQASWRLCNWNQLESTLAKPIMSNDSDFEVHVGRLLLATQKQNAEYFQNLLVKARMDVINSLSAASMESYERVYPFIVKLQSLREMEEGFSSLNQESINRLLNDWDNRIKSTQPSYKAREPILNIRRALFEIFNRKAELGTTLLRLSKLARNSGQYQIAATSILRAK